MRLLRGMPNWGFAPKAVGAGPRSVQGLVLKEGVVLGGDWDRTGVGISLLAGRYLKALLYGFPTGVPLHSIRQLPCEIRNARGQAPAATGGFANPPQVINCYQPAPLAFKHSRGFPLS